MSEQNPFEKLIKRFRPHGKEPDGVAPGSVVRLPDGTHQIVEWVDWIEARACGSDWSAPWADLTVVTRGSFDKSHRVEEA